MKPTLDVYTWAHAPIVAGIILAAAALEEITGRDRYGARGRTAVAADCGTLVLRRVFEDAGVRGVTIETDDDILPLGSTTTGGGSSWDPASGGRSPSSANDLAAQVRASCDAFIEDHGVDEVATRSRYAVVVRD